MTVVTLASFDLSDLLNVHVIDVTGIYKVLPTDLLGSTCLLHLVFKGKLTSLDEVDDEDGRGDVFELLFSLYFLICTNWDLLVFLESFNCQFY